MGGPMEYQALGNTSLKISRIGFGCWAMGGHGWGQVSDRESIDAVKTALEFGINFFDTADVYGFGHSEEILSKALGNRRHDVVIATKFGVSWDEAANIGRNCSEVYIMKAVDASLKRLNIDCIPLYQIHWPDPKTPFKETVRALQKCRKQGKIKYIGCSNFSDKNLLQALVYADIQSIQLPYNILRREIESEMIPLSIENKLSVLVYDTLARGLLSGKYGLNTAFGSNDSRSRDSNFIGQKFKDNLLIVEKLRTIGGKYGKSPAQVAIRWVLDNPLITCAIIGMKTDQQVKDNLLSINWNIPKEDLHILAEREV